ncbi:hypothetical protein IWQ48_005933 [Labrenzia sp. EL_13]|nr:hypothetical protein [Labrenzia sp. EL_13]
MNGLALGMEQPPVAASQEKGTTDGWNRPRYLKPERFGSVPRLVQSVHKEKLSVDRRIVKFCPVEVDCNLQHPIGNYYRWAIFYIIKL